MATIKLKICMGTMCYVMGGADLKAIVETLPEEMRSQIEISYSPCLGNCNEAGEPPYVEVNGKTITCLSKSGLIQILKEELGNVI